MKKRRIPGLLLTLGMILGMSLVANAKEITEIHFQVPSGSNSSKISISGGGNVENGDIIKKGADVYSEYTDVVVNGRIMSTLQSSVDIIIDGNKTTTLLGNNGAYIADQDYEIVDIVNPKIGALKTVDGVLTYDYTLKLSSLSVAPKSISLSATKLTLTAGGDTATLTATISPDNATDKSVIWSSDNTAAATVDSNGVVTPVKEGTAVITAKCNANPEVKATCTVTVEMSAANKKTA